jgi:hypothetical protein
MLDSEELLRWLSSHSSEAVMMLRCLLAVFVEYQTARRDRAGRRTRTCRHSVPAPSTRDGDLMRGALTVRKKQAHRRRGKSNPGQLFLFR